MHEHACFCYVSNSAQLFILYYNKVIFYNVGILVPLSIGCNICFVRDIIFFLSKKNVYMRALQPGHQISGVGHLVSFLIISNFVVCAHFLWNLTYMLMQVYFLITLLQSAGILELLLTGVVEATQTVANRSGRGNSNCC